MSRAERVDAATPESRNRVVDFLRAAAITVVVLGHWTIIAVDPDGGILPHGVLDGAPWTHPLTWLFQVMPIFFLVGGYSNGLSWRSARRKEIGYAEWLRTRLRRLGIPLIPLLLAWLVIGVVAGELVTGVLGGGEGDGGILLRVEEVARAQVAVAVGVAGVHGGGLQGGGEREVLAALGDGQRALDLAEAAAHLGDAGVAHGEARGGVGGVQGPGTGGELSHGRSPSSSGRRELRGRPLASV